MNRLVPALLLLLLLPSCQPQEERVLTEFVYVGETIAPELQGVWESRGYGWVLHAEQDSLTLYDRAGEMWTPSSHNEALHTLLTHYHLDRDVLRLSSGPRNFTVYIFDRLAQLPETCCDPPAPTVQNTFEFFCDTMEEQYASFDIHNVNWEERVAKAAPQVRDDLTDEAFFDVLCDMLRGIPDDHLLLYAELENGDRQFSPGPSRVLTPLLEEAFANQDSIDTYKKFRRNWVGHYRNNTATKILDGEYIVEGGGRIVWGRIGSLGYMNILSMAGYGQDESADAEVAGIREIMSRVVEGLTDTDGLILDITMNHGGYDEVGLAIAGFFASDTTFVYDKAARGARAIAPQKIFVFPHAGVRYPHPVTLVTSDETVSAGETFALSMRAQPQVTHVGTETRGCFSDMLSKRLPNDWLFFLSNETYRDRDGRNWEGKGVRPNTPVAVFTKANLFTSHSEAILGLASTFTN